PQIRYSPKSFVCAHPTDSSVRFPFSTLLRIAVTSAYEIGSPSSFVILPAITDQGTIRNTRSSALSPAASARIAPCRADAVCPYDCRTYPTRSTNSEYRPGWILLIEKWPESSVCAP